MAKKRQFQIYTVRLKGTNQVKLTDYIPQRDEEDGPDEHVPDNHGSAGDFH